MLSCVHCKYTDQLPLALGCASSVMEMWIFSSASGCLGSEPHPYMPKHTEHSHHIQYDLCLWNCAP